MGLLRVRHYWVTSLSHIGEGNGNPHQCSCLVNPRDGGAWWAAVYGVAQSWTQLKCLSSSSSRYMHMAQNLKDRKIIQWKVLILLLSLSHLFPSLVTITAIRFLGITLHLMNLYSQHITHTYHAFIMVKAFYCFNIMKTMHYIIKFKFKLYIIKFSCTNIKMKGSLMLLLQENSLTFTFLVFLMSSSVLWNKALFLYLPTLDRI